MKAFWLNALCAATFHFLLVLPSAAAAADQGEAARRDPRVAAEIAAVLHRAAADYPILKAPEGQPLLRRIIDRHKALVAQGLYPSTAMVEAVADHAHLLAPRTSTAVQVVRTTAPVQEPPPATIGNCRWTSPLIWSCEGDRPAR